MKSFAGSPISSPLVAIVVNLLLANLSLSVIRMADPGQPSQLSCHTFKTLESNINPYSNGYQKPSESPEFLGGEPLASSTKQSDRSFRIDNQHKMHDAEKYGTQVEDDDSLYHGAQPLLSFSTPETPRFQPAKPKGTFSSIKTRFQKSFLWQGIKYFFYKVFKFFWGDGFDTGKVESSRLDLGPNEEAERRAIINKFIGAAIPESEKLVWFENLKDSFERLPAITAWGKFRINGAPTVRLVKNLVKALLKEHMSLDQRQAIMSALNHITIYNPKAKKDLYQVADDQPFVFEALALTIKDIRLNGLTEVNSNHSFEEEWFSASPTAEERYHRIILIDEKPKALSSDIQDLAERLKFCRNLHLRFDEDPSKGSEIKHIMADAIQKVRTLNTPKELEYLYKLIRHMGSVNEDVFKIFEKELSDDSFRIPIVKAQIGLLKDHMHALLPGNTFERKILLDRHLGPLLEQTFIRLEIPLKTMSTEIIELTENIFSCDVFPIASSAMEVENKKNPLIFANEIFKLMEFNERNFNSSADEKKLSLKLLDYMVRWHPLVKEKTGQNLRNNPSFLTGFATLLASFHPEEMLVQKPDSSLEDQLLSDSKLAERVAREPLIPRNNEKSAWHFPRVSERLDKLPLGWYTDLLLRDPESIAEGLLSYIGSRSLAAQTTLVEKAIKMLQHMTHYQPKLKQSALVEITKPSNIQLRRQLRSYCQQKKWASGRSFTGEFVHWLNEIPIMQHLEDDVGQHSRLQASLFSLAEQSEVLIGTLLRNSVEFLQKLVAMSKLQHLLVGIE
ncbi:hypothetical protein O181_022032 [Austropuccinia psidii MF-1]|uniref:Uncharacterized protein n=1 Tax=Austropuccinia psidii MF-1 TaxID=1389203 RepID=A0A9Q3CEQ2_9BASI|nr:hypothetical protein [Austropuccinia psidii MF-1]